MWIGLSNKKVKNLDKSIPLDRDTNTGKIIYQIESQMPKLTYYKTNLVKCLPQDDANKLRYPTKEEMNKCITNLIEELNTIKPKIIFLLGRTAYNFFDRYITDHKINLNANYFYIEHPSYIYVYKRKYIDEYISKVIDIIKENI